MKFESKIFLKKDEEKSILDGFPWVFKNEIEILKGKIQKDFPLVEVFSSSGLFLGCGIFNEKSKIAVRFLSNERAKNFLENRAIFFEQKILQAAESRKIFFSQSDSYRLIFAESDFLPGLIVERFFSQQKVILVVQFLSLCAEIFREDILCALKKIVRPDFIFERSEGDARKKEGLLEKKSLIFFANNFSEFQKNNIIIEENGLKFCVDLENGQKTGFFLDQKFNRMLAQKFTNGKKVLDAFCHTGAFGLNALKAKAANVIFVDSSEDALNIAKENFSLNFLKSEQNKTQFLKCDVFDFLRQKENEGEKFDVIILDPPAFAKSAKSIQKAFGAYKEINLRAMKILSSGGILISCSCSHYFDSNLFYLALQKAAKDSKRHLQILKKCGAAPDHPIRAGYSKSEYLKCAMCKVI